MKNKLFLPIMLCISAGFFLVLFFIVLLYAAKNIIVIEQTSEYTSSPVVTQSNLSTAVPPSITNLSVIYIKLRNPGYQNKEPFQFVIQDKNGTILRSVTISGANIGSDEWVKFQINPLNIGLDGATITLHSDTMDTNRAVQVAQQVDGSFVMKLYRKGTLSEAFQAVNDQIKQAILHDQSFFLGYSITLLACMTGLIYILKFPQKTS